MSRIMITFTNEEKRALLALAEKEYRDPRGQVALIVRKELERQGFIEIPKPVKASSAHAGLAMKSVDLK
jgi:hypothetical protein